jgi:hypothetical protein
MMLTRKAVAALLHAAIGAPAHPATIAAGLARLDKLLRARGIDRERPDAAALLVRYADRVATPESTWAALLALAPVQGGQEVAKDRPKAKAPAAAKTALATARKGAQRYRLPAPGTKLRMVFDLMRRPGGTTNREIYAATRIDASWAVDGRRWAERHGLTFTRTEEIGPKGIKRARYSLTGSIPGEDEPAAS